ncbi:hypothetical protein Ptr902_10995 [Pyrenophora tritici-repentis]|nr:hypothetical protein Ptr902_12380 [Pyrenophora tritici-repentis]KAI2477833.1 hypothetical protein Ptr902_10995 [Pyrenophora tritici-repentis]
MSSSPDVHHSSPAQLGLSAVQDGSTASLGAATEHGSAENNVEYREDVVDQNTTHDSEAQQPSIDDEFMHELAKAISRLQEEEVELPAPSDVANMTEAQLDSTYHNIMLRYGFRRIVPSGTEPVNTEPVSPEPVDEPVDESSYIPRIWPSDVNPPRQNAPLPLYPAYTGHFQTREEARAYRQRSRLPPKLAPDLERVKRYGRQYWVRRIYEAMIDRSNICDKDNSINRQRFDQAAGFEPLDLEAVAHHVFDSALAVHERGFSRPRVYHKKVVRGKLVDNNEDLADGDGRDDGVEQNEGQQQAEE